MNDYSDPDPAAPPPQGIWAAHGTARLVLMAVLWAAANLVAQTLTYAWTGDMFAAVSAGGVMVLMLAAWTTRQAGGTLAADFGLCRAAPGVLTLSVLASLAALLPTSFLAGLSCEIHPPTVEWIAYFNEHFPDTPLRGAIAVTAVTIFGPLAEELVFRGLVFRLALRVWGFLPAALISALLFGLAHGEPWFLFGLVGLGLVLAYVYDRTGSLTACVVLHAVHNGVSLALMYRQGGILDQAALDAPVDWPLLAVSCAALTIVMWLIHRRTR